MDAGSLFVNIFCDSSAFEKGLADAKSSLSKFGGGIGKAFGTVAKVGAAALGAATTAVTAFGAASVKVGMGFDSSMSQVAATMGKTVADLEKETGHASTAFGEFNGNLREFAQYMGSNTAFSATEAADALNYMALAGYSVQESMDMLPNVLSLAAAGSMDLARASDMVTDAQTAFGIEAPRVTQMVDEMAKAASTGNTSVEQLGDAFLVVGGLAQELNGGMVTLKNGTTQSVDGIQELEIALTAMANAGVKGSEAGTHMRNMLLKLSSPTSEGTKALEAMGVSVFDTEGKMRSLSDVFGDLNNALGKMTQEQKISTISELFNTRDMASAEALLNAVSKDWDEIGESILGAEGAAAKMAATQLDNLEGDITLFKSALEGAQIAISDKLSPSLREFVQFGTDGLSKLTQAFQEGGLSGAMEAFGAILSEGLNMIIAKVPEMISAGGQLLAALGQGIMQNLDTIIDATVEITLMVVKGIASGLPHLIEGARQLISGLIQGFSEHSSELMDAGMQIVTYIWNGLKNNMSEILSAGADLILFLAEGLGSALPTLIPEAVEMILTIVSGILDNADKLVDAAIAIIEGLASGLISALPMLIEKAPEIIVKLVAALCEAAPKLLEAATTIISQLVVSLVENAPQLLEGAVAIVESLLLGIVSLYQSITEAGGEIITKLLEGLESIGFDAFQWGLDLIMGIVDGIKGGWDALTEAVGGAAGLIRSFLHFSVPDEGPLADAESYMPDMMQLFADGVLNNGQLILTAMTNVLTQLVNTIKTNLLTAIQTVQTSLTTILNNAIDFGKNLVEQATANGVEMLATVNKWLSELPTRFVRFITEAVNKFMDILRQLPGKVASVLSDIIKKVADFGKQLIDKAVEAARGFVDGLVNGVRTAVDQMASIGQEIVSGLWNGISAGWGWLQDQVSGLANSLVEGVKGALKISSPSKKFMWVGEMVDRGFAEGIENYRGLIDAAMGDIEASTNINPSFGEMSVGSSGENRSVTINVYPSQGMDERELAQDISYYLANEHSRTRAVWSPTYA